jgi:phospholipase/carboxylesterase
MTDMHSQLDSIERETGPAPTHSIVWLHGLGADGNDFVPLVPELVRPKWPALRFVFPHAPIRPVTINAGMRMRAWYDITGFGPLYPEDATGMRASMAQTEALIARELERGVPAERVFLAGFSQGGAITLATALRRQAPLAGAIALSTYLPLATHAAAESTDIGRSVPVFMAHGSFDPLVDEARGIASRDALQALGVRVDWHVYPMAHQVCAEEISDLGDWLQARLR